MGKYMIVRKEDYEWLRDENARMKYNYDYLSKLTNVEIESMRETIDGLKGTIKNLDETITLTLDKLNLAETARRTNAGKIGGLTASLNKEKKENEELQSKVKDLEVKLEESMSDKYRVKKIPSGRPPKTQTMKLKNCSVESKIARKMFGDSK